MKTRMNHAFAALWREGGIDEQLPVIDLQPRLRDLIHAPFVRTNVCLMLEPLAAGVSTIALADVQDRTGFEALASKIRVDDFLDSEAVSAITLLEQAGKAALVLAERLTKEGNYSVVLTFQNDERRDGLELTTIPHVRSVDFTPGDEVVSVLEKLADKR